MADNLRVGVEVDGINSLDNLGTAAKGVEAGLQGMSSGFGKSQAAANALATALLATGSSADEAAKEMIKAGYSANAAATALGVFKEVTKQAGNEAEVTATKVTMMERAMAAGDIRVISSIAGLGGLGSAFARVGAASSSLAPVLAAAFPVVAVIAFVDIIGRAIEAYEKWITLGEETVHKTDDVTLSLAHEADQMEVVNIRLENQIAKLEHKPEDFLKLALAENKVAADALAKSLEDVLQKEVTILKAGPGFGSTALLQKGNVAEVGKLLEPLQRQLQLANLIGDKNAQVNILLEKQQIFQKAIADEQGTLFHAVQLTQAQLASGAIQGKDYYTNVRGQTPDQDALNTYRSLLQANSIELDKINKLDTAGALETQKAHLQTAAEQEAAAKKLQDLIDKNKENAIRGAREEAAAMARGIKEWAELEEKANRALEADDKRIASESKKDAREAMDAWQRTAEAHIKGEEEAFRVQQQTSENRLKDIKAQESASTAGLNKGPIRNVIESTSLQEQGAVAAQAMQQAQEAAKGYQSELDIVKDVMAEVNQKSEEGAAQFKDLQKQAEQLQHAMDSAAGAAGRWGTTLDQIKAKQKELGTEMGFSWNNIKLSMENSIQSGFTAFNSAFTRMLAGGISFVRVMQTLWTSMVDTFVTSVLQMAEAWITKKLIMIALEKVFGQAGTTNRASQIAADEAERQAAIGAAAAEAAVSQAINGPAAAIAAAAITMGALEGITAYERGGIVSSLHEGEMVLPKHLSTFIQTAAGAAGGMGGQGGPGGPGGPGGSGNVTHNRVHLEVHNHGGEMDEGQLAKMVTKELRRMNLT